MKKRYWLFKRGAIYYIEDSTTGKQMSLQTKDKREAERLRKAKLDTVQQPLFNLILAKTYLSAHDPKLVERIWAEVMEKMALDSKEQTRKTIQCSLKSKAFNHIRNLKLIETTSDDLFRVLSLGSVATIKYLRQLHNLALGLGWLPMPIIPPKLWPKMKFKEKRAIRWEEHQQIVENEKDEEWKLFYEILWEIGASQGDAAELSSENIDWKERLLIYNRKKLEPTSQPARLSLGERLEKILLRLPSQGQLFASLSKKTSSWRSVRFRHVCKKLRIMGVSLHSYRYAWAERARINGYPERWAQAALGHSSKAVHQAYAKGAQVVCPSLEEYEKSNSLR